MYANIGDFLRGEYPEFFDSSINSLEAMHKRAARAQYAAACRAWGIVNRLPIEQRRKHYSRICGIRNKLRGMV